MKITTKKCMIFIIGLLFLQCSVSYSQNWKPVNIHDKYNYRIDTADIITNVIFVDSVEIIEADSVFYLNRIMTNCDTCSDNQYNYFALKNQPQFLMRKMIKESDSSFIFSDTSEFVLKPLKHFGDSWTFNQTENTDAVISFEGEDEIFGIVDSVKYISLSDGKMIQISKNYGIIQFPSKEDHVYELTGIEGSREFGERLSGFWDFFGWDVGDVFQRLETSSVYGDGFENDYYFKKFEIITKQIIGDTVIYEIDGWVKHVRHYETYWNFIYDTIAYRFSDELILVDSMNHFTNLYPNQLIDIADHTFDLFNYEIMLNKVELFTENDLNVKKTGEDCDSTFPFYIEENPGSDLLVRNILGGPDGIELRYIEELGLNFKWLYFEMMGSDEFMGKVHDGDTIGIIYPDSHFTQYSNITNIPNKDIKIFPNPVKNGSVLYINSDEVYLNYTFTDISGTEVNCGKILSNRIYIPNLIPGIYLLKLVSHENSIIKKINIQ